MVPGVQDGGGELSDSDNDGSRDCADCLDSDLPGNGEVCDGADNDCAGYHDLYDLGCFTIIFPPNLN